MLQTMFEKFFEKTDLTMLRKISAPENFSIEKFSVLKISPRLVFEIFLAFYMFVLWLPKICDVAMWDIHPII